MRRSVCVDTQVLIYLPGPFGVANEVHEVHRRAVVLAQGVEEGREKPAAPLPPERVDHPQPEALPSAVHRAHGPLRQREVERVERRGGSAHGEAQRRGHLRSGSGARAVVIPRATETLCGDITTSPASAPTAR